MSVSLTTLIAELEDRAPIGVELPRIVDTHEINEDVIERWAKDAAGEINKRRRKTTRKETEITTTENQQEYDLPDDCRRVTNIIRAHSSDTYEILGVPQHGDALGVASFGTIPTGQEISGSIDLINRQKLGRMKREDGFEHIGTQVRLLFVVQAAEKVRVIYEAVDRSLESVPEDRFELVMTYLVFRTLDRHLGRNSVNIVADGDSLATESLTAMRGQMLTKQDEWFSGLNMIGPEVD